MLYMGKSTGGGHSQNVEGVQLGYNLGYIYIAFSYGPLFIGMPLAWDFTLQ